MRRQGRGATTAGQFTRHVSEAFAFLEHEYGFSRVGDHGQSYAHWVEYQKAGVKVVIHYEPGSPPWVALEAPASLEPGLRRDFGLHELEQEQSRKGDYHRRPSAPATLEESVVELAAILRRVGDQVLKGDFGMLFDRQRRHVEAVRRNRSH